MSAETLQMISIFAFFLAAVFFIVGIVLFFRLDVRSIVDDLSGRKAERQIRELREQNIHPQAGGKMTEPLQNRRRAELEDEETTVLEEVTTVLEEETTVLKEGEGKLLGNGYRLWLNEVIVHTEEEV